MIKDKVIAIVGPTAVGKTALSIALAKKLNTEIISGDSMLVYQGMDIGTAKPDLVERDGVVHHLIDILPSDAEFSVTQFQEKASELIRDINRRGHIPIIAGGTGLYVKSLLEQYSFNTTPSDESYRYKLEALAELYGKEYVHAMLADVDPVSAARLHVNDFRRVIRALEVYHLSGEFISQEKSMTKPIYDTVVIGLTMDRALLYERINKRVDLMLVQGLVGEVGALLKQGIAPDCQSMKGIGYKEMIRHLHGEISLDEATRDIKQATRRFAKRQLTWFRKMPYITWLYADTMNEEKIIKVSCQKIEGEFHLT